MILKELDHCTICPRECGINRNAGHKGYCGRDAGYHIASICIHRGEEPVISGLNGICNIFFRGCNLRCLYCQNYQISRNNRSNTDYLNLEQVTERIIEILDSGVEAIGFVSPSHFTPHVKAIIHSLNASGYTPVTIYNTNAFDKVEILSSMEGLIDVYLPDFKYLDPEIAVHFSDAESYPRYAKAALREMFRQKGSTVVLNNNGQAVTGMIIRHLVLPGQSGDSIRILEWIASELSPSVYISLMSQYYPTMCIAGHPVLDRKITIREYSEVLNAMDNLGFYRGWIQEFESTGIYRPDFDRADPFEV